MARFSDKALQEVLKGKRAIAVVHYPGAPHISLGVRILSDDDHEAAREEAAKHTAKRAADLMIKAPELMVLDPEHSDIEIRRQIIARAFVDPDGPKPPADPVPFFESPTAVRQLPSVDVEVLFQMYVEHQNSVSPLQTLDEEQIKELADALKKEQLGPALLAMYDAPTLRTLVRSLVNQPSS